MAKKTSSQRNASAGHERRKQQTAERMARLVNRDKILREERLAAERRHRARARFEDTFEGDAEEEAPAESKEDAKKAAEDSAAAAVEKQKNELAAMVDRMADQLLARIEGAQEQHERTIGELNDQLNSSDSRILDLEQELLRLRDKERAGTPISKHQVLRNTLNPHFHMWLTDLTHVAVNTGDVYVGISGAALTAAAVASQLIDATKVHCYVTYDSVGGTVVITFGSTLPASTATVKYIGLFRMGWDAVNAVIDFSDIEIKHEGDIHILLDTSALIIATTWEGSSCEPPRIGGQVFKPDPAGAATIAGVPTINFLRECTPTSSIAGSCPYTGDVRFSDPVSGALVIKPVTAGNVDGFTGTLNIPTPPTGAAVTLTFAAGLVQGGWTGRIITSTAAGPAIELRVNAAGEVEQ